MTDTLTTAAGVLLSELSEHGVELQAHGDRLRFRPQKSMTPDLVARVAAHKPELLALLTITKTPTDDDAIAGFGCGDVGDVPTATECTADESRMLADAPADARDAVDPIKRAFCGAELMSIRKADTEPEPVDAAAWVTPDSSGGLPPGVTDLALQRDGWTPATWRDRLLQLVGSCEALHSDRAGDLCRAAIAMTSALIEMFEERAAIMEYDGGMSRELAEAAATADTITLIEGMK